MIILTSHDYNFVSKVSDKILFLKEGKFSEEYEQLSLDVLQKRYIEIFGLDLEE